MSSIIPPWCCVQCEYCYKIKSTTKHRNSTNNNDRIIKIYCTPTSPVPCDRLNSTALSVSWNSPRSSKSSLNLWTLTHRSSWRCDRWRLCNTGCGWLWGFDSRGQTDYWWQRWPGCSAAGARPGATNVSGNPCSRHWFRHDVFGVHLRRKWSVALRVCLTWLGRDWLRVWRLCWCLGRRYGRNCCRSQSSCILRWRRTFH